MEMEIKLMTYEQFMTFAENHMSDDFNMLGFIQDIYRAGFIAKADLCVYMAYGFKALNCENEHGIDIESGYMETFTHMKLRGEL